MAADNLDHNRLVLEMDREVRDLNRRVINPMIPELRLQDISPAMAVVAQARGAYLKAFFALKDKKEGELPTPEEIGELKALRETYEELVHAAQALETAIRREYLDVKR